MTEFSLVEKELKDKKHPVAVGHRILVKTLDVAEKTNKGIYNIVINEKHPAYPNFINLLERADKIKPDDEPSAEKGLKLLFESWARMEDEAPDSLRDQLQDLRYQWGALARDFFKS